MFIDGQPGMTGGFEASFQLLLPQGAACVPPTHALRCGPEPDCVLGTCEQAACALAETHTASFTTTAVTTNGTNLHAGSCGQGNDGGSRAPELIYRLSLATAVSDVEISTVSGATTFDTLVYMRAGCNGAEVACNDDVGSDVHSDAHSGPLVAGDYDIFIDGLGTARARRA